MKHSAGESLAEQIGELWAKSAADDLRGLGADSVVPVPLHWRRRWWRGYNQSEALARPIAARLGLPLCPSWLRRIRHTPDQKGLRAREKMENMRDAFHGAGQVRRAERSS